MLPRVLIHNGVSVDGRMDWLKINIGLYYELISEMDFDAILVGSNTMLAGLEGMPLEQVEQLGRGAADEANGLKPIMVLVDSRGRVNMIHQLRSTPYWRDTIVLSCPSTPQHYLEYLDRNGIHYLVTGEDHVDLKAALTCLKQEFGLNFIRVDSGGILNGVLLRQGLVDELSILLSPALVGGSSPRSFFVAPDLKNQEAIIPLKLIQNVQVQDDHIWLRYEVIK